MDETFRQLLRGKRAHADPVAILADVPFPAAGRVIDGYPHSIWQIVEHMNYWMEYDLGKIAGENPVYPNRAIESWPSHPDPASEAQWQAATRRFGELLAHLAELSESEAESLERIIRNVGPEHSPRQSTVHTMLWQVVVHNSYHVGQIALLRRQLDTWPPRRGGDTW